MAIDRDQIAQKLNEKGATRPCHRCGQNSFIILEGFDNIQLLDKFTGGLLIGGSQVPVANIACNNCGAITSHALGALGMLPKEEAADGKQ